jgi:nucleoid-associated protein YgaU
MGIFKKKQKADFSAVQSGSASSAPAQPAAAQPEGAGGGSASPGGQPHAARRTYTVAEGDTLSAIAQREYGAADRWKAIFEANRDQISDPDLIQPGQVLTIPPAP